MEVPERKEYNKTEANLIHEQEDMFRLDIQTPDSLIDVRLSYKSISELYETATVQMEKINSLKAKNENQLELFEEEVE